jgi:hypothetical protein
MGNTLLNKDNSQNTYLYEISHDVMSDDYDRKHAKFYTNLLGVFCFLEYSKHKSDTDIKLIVYENKLNLYALDDDQKGMILTVFPSLDKDYIPKDLPETVACKELSRLLSTDLKIGQVHDIDKTYGSYLYVDKSKLSVCEYITVQNVYDLDVSKITEDLKSKLKNLNNEKEKLDSIISENIVKDNVGLKTIVNQQILEMATKQKEKQKEKEEKTEEKKEEKKEEKTEEKSEEKEKTEDGKRKSNRSKSKRKSKRSKSKSRRKSRKIKK